MCCSSKATWCATVSSRQHTASLQEVQMSCSNILPQRGDRFGLQKL